MLITASARAQTPPAAPTPAAPPASKLTPRQQELLQQYDRNHDGKLDEDEMVAARTGMRKAGEDPAGEKRKKMLKLFDKNGDGKLDDTERAAAEKARDEYRRKHLVKAAPGG